MRALRGHCAGTVYFLSAASPAGFCPNHSETDQSDRNHKSTALTSNNAKKRAENRKLPGQAVSYSSSIFKRANLLSDLRPSDLASPATMIRGPVCSQTGSQRPQTHPVWENIALGADLRFSNVHLRSTSTATPYSCVENPTGSHCPLRLPHVNLRSTSTAANPS